MKILAIDPGTTESAWVFLESGVLKGHNIHKNEDILSIVTTLYADVLAVEMIASYGMPVGKSTFETCVWIGRFVQQFIEQWKKPFSFIYRKDVKMLLCNSMRAKDGNVRQAIIDRYKPTGGGKTPQIGTKKEPGPLYGVSKDEWSALGVAITYQEILGASEKGNTN
jgi:hypothetical protein